jgi:hypothetical protein
MSLRSLGRLADALGAVGDLLRIEGNEQYLVVVGGVAMNLRGFVDRATADVDVIARGTPAPGGTPILFAPDPLPPVLERAISRVGRDFGLDPDWLNTAVARQWHPSAGMPPGLAEDLEWYEFGALHVGAEGRKPMIMLKLFAAVDTGPRSVHVQDLLRLDPSDDELEHAAAWVVTQDAGEDFHAQVHAMVEHVRHHRARPR